MIQSGATSQFISQLITSSSNKFISHISIEARRKAK